MQEKFIQYLKEKASNKTSFADEVATVLDIGYDAAYRRINLKTNLTLQESVKLAKHFKISLNKLYEIGSQHTILAERSPRIINQEHLESYFTQSINNLKPLTKLKSASIIYSAKDIPLFYTLKDSFITRYKIYVWLKFTNKEMTKNKISFDDFNKGDSNKTIALKERASLVWPQYILLLTSLVLCFYMPDTLYQTIIDAVTALGGGL